MIWAEVKDWYLDGQWTEEKKRVIRAIWPGVTNRNTPIEEFRIPSGRQRLTWDEVQALCEAGIKLDMEPYDGMMHTKMRDVKEHANPYQDFLAGRLVSITLPDIGLLLIDEVTWLDDACTEVLQDHLNNGWRILAVCPPNAQRRPDYILGRRKKQS